MELTALGLCKAFDARPILQDVSLNVRSGETLAILGRSGCGKTTLLRLLAGLLPADSGDVLIDGVPACAPSKDRLLVFQGLEQLFPWLTLVGNVRFAVQKTRPGIGRAAAQQHAMQCLERMGLVAAARQYPYQLSGGMKQRGALARALAVSPQVLFMDEPFSSLDDYTRQRAREAFETLKQDTGAAVVLVTHDLPEALQCATRIAVLSARTKGFAAVLENGGGDIKASLQALLAD